MDLEELIRMLEKLRMFLYEQNPPQLDHNEYRLLDYLLQNKFDLRRLCFQLKRIMSFLQR